MFIIDNNDSIAFSKHQHVQEPLHLTAWYSLLPTSCAIRSADDGEIARFYFNYSRTEAAPPKAGVARVLTARAIGAEEKTIHIQAALAPRVGVHVVGGQGIHHH